MKSKNFLIGLAHASHWNMGHSDFNNTDLIVKESWASGTENNLDAAFSYWNSK